MTGGSERGAGDGDGTDASAQVPIGWRRTVDNGAVAYISPSGTILSSVEEVGSYLLTDGTCKCGLECPLVVHKVFNFDPGAVLVQRSQPPGKAEEDMTKLCNHRRKVVAMAALCRSMQASSQLPLAAHGTGGPFCSVESRDLRVGPLGAWEEGGCPRGRLEGMLQQYKDSGSTPPHPQPAAVQSNQSNFQLPQSPLAPPPAFPDRKSAPAANANASAGFLGQLLSQQKQQHASSFPASSLLSAAAKAQLASQKSQNQNQNPSPSGGANANAPGGANEAQQSKVLISTLHSSARTPPTTHALLIPHSSPSPSSSPSSSSSSPRAQRPLLDKAAQRKRQRRSPTVLSMLKESQLHSLRAAAPEPSSSSSTSLLLHPHPENHLQPSPAPGPPPSSRPTPRTAGGPLPRPSPPSFTC
ncbi:hypothetical protein ANANG_G00256130 [Anguilla anguilla]|uniref:MBD domain-containing protein n=1 Tax=Anguilla anguilla TaxID=7936 RepID=A0A9D3LWM0_ANGAN|nr:hypothetical protein ANANG_G00256130 [Anguilla anguilla]